MSAKTKMGSFVCIILCLGVVSLTITARALRAAAAGDDQPTIVAASAPALNSSRSLWRMSYVATKSSGAAQGPQGDKTVDQTRKNIQVLKGLPDSQLFLVMNFVAVSLGEQCNFCHVQEGRGGRNDFATDEKAPKKTARVMITMMNTRLQS